MRAVALMVFLLRECLGCPPTCDCKWKSGKESAICVRNNLTHIPKGIDSSTQLLDLTGNRISSIGRDAFERAGLLNLQRIYLAKCGIRDMDRFAFRRLTNLVELDLSYNSISSVPSHIFDSISELRELKLSGNLIQRISNDAFINVRQLVKLELSECRIAILEPRAFHGLEQSLEWLKLERNRLVDVRPITFTILSNLHGLELAGNPWNCSCRLRPLRQWMSVRNVPSNAPPSCSHPYRLRGKTWDRLLDIEFACNPVMHRPTYEVQTIEGTNVTLPCFVTGNPTPTVRWMWKNRPIANVSGIPSHRKLYILHYNGTISTLTVFSAEIADAGVYFCVASNKAGRVQGNVTLSVLRRQPEDRLTSKVLIVGVAMAFLFLVVSGFFFWFFGQPRKPPRVSQAENYEKIEMERKGEACFSEAAPAHKVHPTLCEYRGIPTVEEGDDDSVTPTAILKTNPTTPSSQVQQLCGELSGLQQHVLRREVLPTTSLYTTAPPEDRTIPDLVTSPPSIVTATATLPRTKDWYTRGSNSQSPLLAGSRCGSSTGESSTSNSRRYSMESRASAHYSYRPRKCERSASSLDLFEQEHMSWQRPSLPPSPTRHRPYRCFKMSETPILTPLDSAKNHKYEAAHMDRFLGEYQHLQNELTKVEETCHELRTARAAELFARYAYRT